MRACLRVFNIKQTTAVKQNDTKMHTVNILCSYLLKYSTRHRRLLQSIAGFLKQSMVHLGTE
jgi:hypothetical protein